MRKAFTLSIMLSLATILFAQESSKIGATEPEFIPEFNTEDVTVSGISNEGRYIYGVNGSGSAAIYDYQNTIDPMRFIEASQSDYFGISVAGFTPDGKVLVSHYMRSYFLDMTDGTEIALESPDENYGLDAWAISTDGKYIGCNLTTEDFFVLPMVAEKQEDGTYKMIYLDYDENDAMGCPAQYTQVRFISEDGSYIIGIQPDNRGMGGRLIVWVKQEDGSYKFTTPLDEFLYDLSMEKPGLAPEWDDFVTADYETEPELFQQQSDAFDEAFLEYEVKYNNFTRNQSALEIYMMNKGTRSNTVCMAFYDNRTSSDMNMIPLFYNCETEKVTDFPDMINSFGINVLPGGGFIAATDNGGLRSLTAIDEAGNKEPFETWFNEKTGVDLAKDYTFTFYDFINDQDVSGVFPGLPYFSQDGQTMVLTGSDPEIGTIASVIKFDSDIFATATGISANVVSNVTIGNNMITLGEGKQGVADVYTLSGAKCGSYTVNETFNFNGILSKGAYIVKMNIANEKPISMKIIVK